MGPTSAPIASRDGPQCGLKSLTKYVRLRTFCALVDMNSFFDDFMNRPLLFASLLRIREATKEAQCICIYMHTYISIYAQDKTRHDKTRQGRARQDKAGHGKKRRENKSYDKTRQDKTRQDTTTHGEIRRDKTRQDKTSPYMTAQA